MNMTHPPDLILASTSPYRRQLLERLQLPFSCIAPGVDEAPAIDEAPEQLALRLGRAKALAVAHQAPDARVLGSDQVAWLPPTLLGKPGTSAAACAQLALCSGQTVTFYTSVVLAQDQTVLGERCVCTSVQFRALSEAMIARYVALEQPLDCAGSFRWEGLGICLFTALRSDDPTALEGLPLIATCDLLRSAGYILP
jgi:septum formation protein